MIFEDLTRHRWKRTLQIGALLALGAAIVMSCLLSGVFLKPELTDVALSAKKTGTTRELVDTDEKKTSGGTEAAPGVANQSRLNTRQTIFPLLTKQWVTSAFVVQDDHRSVEDLQTYLPKLDIVFPDWYTFSQRNGTIKRSVNPRVKRMVTTGHTAIVPRLSNTDSSGAWRGDAASEMLKDFDARPRITAALVDNLLRDSADGINIDIEGLVPGDREHLLDWLQELATALHRNKLSLTIDVPLYDEAFDYEAIGRIADAVVVMAYDQHYPTGSKGPIADKTWFDNGLEEIARRVPPQKLLAGIGGYGYDWDTASKKPAETLGFDDAMILAAQYGAEIQTEAATVNSAFTYNDDNGHRHDVWFLDAVSAWNQLLTARDLKVRGMSLWRLGIEEPALWDFAPLQSTDGFDPRQLATVKQRNLIAMDNNGELLKINHSPSEGRRELTFDSSSIDYAGYKALPKYYSIKRFGHDSSRKLALTFDDGPDPVWTEQILQVLKKHKVSATFFIVGSQAENYPHIVRQAYNDGHLIGNHTFSHPNIELISDTRLTMELNLTQRIIESITGHSTTLYRSPYDTDSSPTRSAVLHGLAKTTGMGYVIVSGDIDSEDYTKPGVDHIIDNIKAHLKQSESNIIVMHDGGGDRQQTVMALDRIIPLLKSEGYEFVGVDQLMGVPRDVVMSKVHPSEQVISTSGRILIWMKTWGWNILQTLFFVATTIAIIRILFVGYFVLRRTKSAPAPAPHFTPPVAVIVPAYNEAKVIRRTLETLLRVDYPNLRIVVIDDGSSDETAAIVSDMIVQHPLIVLISQPNSGKHSALNLGFETATEDFIVTIDADTLVQPHTVHQLIAPFADPDVDAVCGNVQVGNVRNLLTAFQDVEYVTSQNYDRRAFDSLNCISVVPGATGAWRRKSVLDAGGYSRETLTEDADLTLTILEAGGRIVYAPEARSITEAPETPRALFKQRFRWSFGTFQCLWKHRKQFGHGALGWVALPNMLTFQVVFPLLSPIGDIVFLLSLFRGELGAVMAGYTTFVILDLLASVVAFRLDHRPVGRLWIVLIQRLYYRQFMYVVTFKSVFAVLRGRRHGWNKLERHASALTEELSHASRTY